MRCHGHQVSEKQGQSAALTCALQHLYPGEDRNEKNCSCIRRSGSIATHIVTNYLETTKLSKHCANGLGRVQENSTGAVCTEDETLGLKMQGPIGRALGTCCRPCDFIRGLDGLLLMCMSW